MADGCSKFGDAGALSALTQVTPLRATPRFSVNSVRRFFDFDGLTLSALVAT